MLIPVRTGVTLDEVYAYGEDGVKRELIDGRMFSSPEAGVDHQRILRRLVRLLDQYFDDHPGEVFPGCNVDFRTGEHVEPDVVAIRPDFDGEVREIQLFGVPSLVAEISSRSTKSYDLRTKLPLYQRQGVPECWFVDRDAQEIVVHRLAEGGTRSQSGSAWPESCGRRSSPGSRSRSAPSSVSVEGSASAGPKTADPRQV